MSDTDTVKLSEQFAERLKAIEGAARAARDAESTAKDELRIEIGAAMRTLRVGNGWTASRVAQWPVFSLCGTSVENYMDMEDGMGDLHSSLRWLAKLEEASSV